MMKSVRFAAVKRWKIFLLKCIGARNAKSPSSIRLRKRIKVLARFVDIKLNICRLICVRSFQKRIIYCSM